MNELDKLISKLIKEKGGTREQYLHLLNSISNHETGGTNSTTQKQIGDGPGRGKYQFEKGKNKGAITAAKRLRNYYSKSDIKIPAWLEKIVQSNDLDVSTLSSEQQDLLFLGNMREHPRADLSKYVGGEESVPEFWANYHWSGPSRQKQVRLKEFNDNYPPQSKVFDPEGEGYDYETAIKYGIKPDSSGHWQSRVPETGQILKGKKHETYHKTIKGEEEAGYIIKKGRDGKYYSQPNLKTYIPEQKQDNTFVPKPIFKQPSSQLVQNEFAYGGDPTDPPIKVKDNTNVKGPYIKDIKNVAAYGGNIKQALYKRDFNSFNVGGTHESNPNGGIPMGIGSNGKQNTVEQGESSFNFKDGKYIFSNRIFIK